MKLALAAGPGPQVTFRVLVKHNAWKFLKKKKKLKLVVLQLAGHIHGPV